MYKSKIYEPAYYSKDNFMLQNYNVKLSLHLQLFKSYSGLNVIVFYFDYYRIAKKQQQIIKFQT